MAVSGKMYANAKYHAWTKAIDLVNDTIKLQLHTSAYTPNQMTHAHQSDLTNEVASANGYTTGGITLSNKTFTQGTKTLTNDSFVFKSDNPSWTVTGGGFTYRYAVIIDTTSGSAATNPLIGYIDFGQDIVVAAGTHSVSEDISGLIRETVL